MKFKILRISAICLFLPFLLNAQSLTDKQIDSIALKAIKTFNVPGLSLAIVKDGKVAYEHGYGVRSFKTKQPMDANTLAGIASNSKAFTAAALGILVDDGKIKWDDTLTRYIPEFKMYDDYVTHNFTIRDLLTHRSGLGAGAGDLLHNPDSTDFTIKDVIRSLQYLKPASSFRSKYAYDNILYMVASELVKRVSGLEWTDFVEQRIMQPLQMADSRAAFERIKGNGNVIDAHHEEDGKMICERPEDAGLDMGAGGIFSSTADMAKWMLMQLNNGRYGEGLSKRLLSEEVHHDMWTPQTILPVPKSGEYNTHFAAYGLGWFLEDVKGYLEISHTGQDEGMISMVLLIPELHYGITVLTNKDGGGAVLATVEQITDSFLGLKGTDKIKKWTDKVANQRTEADTVTAGIWKKAENTKQNQPLTTFTGTYRDPWFGDVIISPYKNRLWFKSVHSHQLKGEMLPYEKNVWIVKWQYRGLNADAFVRFEADAKDNINGISLKPISPATSFAFDFDDLDFKKVVN